jgi:hypothetical protein
MPDLAQELSHLAMADRHIAQARDNIARVSAQMDATDGDHAQAAATLETMNGTLAAFEEHRALIVRTIQDIRDRKV